MAYPPEIIHFSAEPRTLKWGETSILRWTVARSDDVVLEGVGPVPPSGEATVRLDRTTEYVLVAKSLLGSARSTLEVVVDLERLDQAARDPISSGDGLSGSAGLDDRAALNSPLPGSTAVGLSPAEGTSEAAPSAVADPATPRIGATARRAISTRR
jgi:hypothetical protein